MFKRNINAWFNKYCKNCSQINDIDIVIEKAVKLSYKSSILRALYKNNKRVGFNGKKMEAVIARKNCEIYLKIFLQYVYRLKNIKNKQVLSMFESIWCKIRREYHALGITWYNYGNAQKWAAMAVKYFYIIAYKNNLICSQHFLFDSVLPIDRKIMKVIKKDFNILELQPTWSKCDDSSIMIKYLEELKNKLKSKAILQYEIEKW